MADINGILANIGGIMAAFNVSTEFGQAFLKFVEFWLTGFTILSGLFSGLGGS